MLVACFKGQRKMEHVISKLSKKIIDLEKKSASNNPLPADNWNFFKNDLDDEWVVCYLNWNNYSLFINSFLLNDDLFPKICNPSLFEADFSTTPGWGICYHGDKDSPPFIGTSISGRTPPLDQAEPLFFRRHFEGYPQGSDSYFEISQKFTIPLELHWVVDEAAYCTLNILGDLVPQILMGKKDNMNYLLIRRNVFDKFLSITNNVLIRCFEYRQLKNGINYDTCEILKELSTNDANFCFKKSYFIESGSSNGVLIRGYNKVVQNKSYKQIEDEEDEDEKGKDPLEFIVQDIKHACKTIKLELRRENLSSYFEESEKPWETSPVFFRPEIMHKYKNNPDKYQISERTINCRGGWYLYFDINEQNQIHAMAIDLINLPYKELCYWLSYNEDPKGGISKRSFDSDFLTKFSTEPEFINELKNILVKLSSTNIQPENEPLWVAHENNFNGTFFGFNYVFSDNCIEWQNNIQDLARIVIEGLSKKNITKISKRLECNNPQLGSIKLLEQCLQTSKIKAELIEDIIGPLIKLQKDRTTRTKAHRGSQFNSSNLRENAMNQLKSIINALASLEALCSEGFLNGRV